VTSDWNGTNFLPARNWNVAGGMELRNVTSGMVRNGMMERVWKAGNVVYNVFYGVPALYPDAALHGNHWNTQSIFYYLHN